MSDSITADAIREIERLTLAGQRIQYIRPPGWPMRSLIVTGPNGVADTIQIEPPLGSVLATPEAFCDYAANTSDAAPENAIILFNETTLDYVADRSNPKADQAQCDLIPTAEWTWLKSESVKPMTQAQFVRVMRITLRRCQPEAQLLQILRALKFSASTDGGVELRQGKESMGKSIRAEVYSDLAIPEETTLNVRLWENHHAAFQIGCAIEVFPAEQTFKLTPYPGELARLVESGLTSLQSLFAESLPEIRAYRGRPAPYPVAADPNE